ncbi:MAG: chemotaxis protein CheB [Cyanobium sp.]|nr:chemotaxis protein CheB [Cyanobium sp.]
MAVDQVHLDSVVAIGASAGGLDAVQELIQNLPLGGNALYIVAQHLAPDHPSQLADLMKRHTSLDVVVARDGLRPQPGQLVVLPPNSDATLHEGVLYLHEPQPRFGPSPSIDQLFQSVADQYADRAVAVVLSGTGSDGACGLRAVAAAGGLTIVQTPESARFGGMPRAALALGGADLVADPAAIGRYLSSWFGAEAHEPNTDHQSSEPLPLASAVEQLQLATGIDFSQYKESTLRRQLQRRMAMRGLQRLEEYLSLLTSEPEECQSLAQNLLVTVTEFFRNHEAFAALGQHLRPLIATRQSGERVRVWVPGCATGEEVYSIAMSMSEAMGHPENLEQYLKIFATDLDEQSLAVGRRAVYPIAAAKNIPPELLQRFAVLRKHDFEISKALRGCVLFARHNIAEDPPFPNIDLISCRNTLIYFTSPLQERVIELFAFSLRPGGLLFLGSSESRGCLSGFIAIHPLYRIFRRNQAGLRSRRLYSSASKQSPLAPQRFGTVATHPPESIAEQHIKLLEALTRTLLRPALVLDENHDLVEVIGDVSAYCRVPEGRPTAAAGAFLREELQAEARELVLLVRADHAAARSNILQLSGRDLPVRLEAAPLPMGDQVLTVLTFIDQPGDAATPRTSLASPDRNAAFAREIERLERELLSSQNTLRRSMADLEQANEELEASSEELQASSEELQSSNEELEASNEELQATNEELSTLNQQLRSRSDELEHLNTDLENVQNSLNMGMVIVDRELRVTRFSPLAVRVFGLVDQDIGQPLIGVPTTVPLPDLREALLAVLNGEERRSLEATSEDVSYLAQALPYRDRLGQCLGAIITLTDVSEQVALRRAAEASLREFTSLANALDQVVWKRDHGMGRILYISQRIQALTGWSAEQLCAEPELLDRAILSEDRAAVAAARRPGVQGWRVTFRLRIPDGRERAFEEVATVLDDGNDQDVVGTLTDVTDVRRLERRNALLASAFQQIQASEPQAIALLDESLLFVSVSEAFAACFGSSARELHGQSLDSLDAVLTLPQAPGSLRGLVQAVLDGQRIVRQQPVLLTRVEPPGKQAQLDLLPLGESGHGLGVLLQLHSPPADRSG